MKSKLSSKYSPKHPLFSPHHPMRRSLVEEKCEIPISPSNKNYKSNKELDFFKTKTSYGEISNANQSSVESLGQDRKISQKQKTML